MENQEKIFADLHIHSRFSRACSKNINFENLVKWAKIKGLNLLGTGDFTHPVWFNEIKEKLIDNGNGFYYFQDFPFIITGEVSLIYTQGHGRRIHLNLLVPNIETAEKINSYFDTKGRRDYDGRPIFKISCEAFTEDMMRISKDIEVIPAHIWTPWFGVFGSMSGFDSLKEAFGKQFENIHAIETGISCYDKETEVLTNNGWKKIFNVDFLDQVCTLNSKTDEIEFQKPVKLFKYDYKGKMYKLKTKRIDLFVTPNHKLFCSHCDFRKRPDFSLKEAEFLFNKSKRFKKDGKWIGENPKYFVLPEVKIKHGSRYYSGFRSKKKKCFLMKDWLKFFGFWLAEGCVSKGKNGDYGVYFSNKNEKIILELKNILSDFGYKISHQINNGLNIIRIRDYQLFSYLKQFGKSKNKFIPLDIKSLSRDLLKILFEYYIKGDGHVYGRNRKGLSATTISICLRDDLQEIALKLGMSAYYKLHNKKGTPILSLPKAKLKIYEQSADSWNIYFIRQNIHTVMPSTIKKWNYEEKWIDYNDNVYCVQVPNHVIYVRRNGIPVWCGNSDPEMNWKIKELETKSIVSFSDAHSFWPFRLGREATIFKKCDSYKELIRQIRENDFIGTIETDPAYGKYHWDGHRLCNFSCGSEKTNELNGICPVCKKNLVVGVDSRIKQLSSADSLQGDTHFVRTPNNIQKNIVTRGKKKYWTLLPLHEIISLALGNGMQSKKVWEVYNSLIKEFENEFNILLNVSRDDFVKEGVDGKLIGLILKNRNGNIKVKPGYDGVYGVAQIGEEQSRLF